MDSNNVYKLVLEQSRVGLWDWNYKEEKGSINSTFKSLLGYTNVELSDITNFNNLGNLIVPEDFEKATEMMNRHIESKGVIPFEIEARYIHKKGNIIWVTSRAIVTEWDENGDAVHVVGCIVEIMKLKEKEEELIHTNNLNRILSLINTYLLNTDTKQDLYDEVCNIITIVGGIKLVWIGEIENNFVAPVAKAGSPLSYVKNVTITLDDSPTGMGPTARAIRENKRYICNDFLTDINTIPWQMAAKDAGLKSSASFPIQHNNKVLGILNVYADTPNYFKEKEVALFEEIIATIYYGIERIKLSAQKKKAHNRIKLLADIIENSPALISIARVADNSFIYMNNALKETLELAPNEDVTKLSVFDIRPTSSKNFMEHTVLKAVKQNGNWNGTNKLKSRTGKIIPIYQTISLFKADSADKALFMTSNAINISELTAKDAELRELTRHLFNIREEERKNIAKEIHDELGQNLTGLKLGISWLKNHISDDKELLLKKISEIESITTNTVAATRILYNSLYPQMLDDIGLLGAIRWHSNTYLTPNNIDVVIGTNLLEEESVFKKQTNVCLTLYRVYQECATNILRYSKASKVSIDIIIDEGILNMEIKDNGIGYDITRVDTKLHHGLLGMRERISLINGTILQESIVGTGTTNTIKVQMC